MKVRFMNLSVEENERKVLLGSIGKVLEHGILINGPELSEFEQKFANYCGRKYCVGVSSGTDALFFALKALGIGFEDEVITTSLSWIATANAIAVSGATPVFADIDDDLNLNPQSVERLITNKTKAIMPVHYAGRVCKIDEILQIAKKYNLFVIEDASQAVGAKRNGALSGSFGDLACFSMNPMKTLGACGEAGAILTNSLELNEKLQMLRYNGTINKETCIEFSLNGRMDTMQAAILLERLKTFEGVIEKRREIAAIYDEALKEIVETPIEASGEINSYYSYTIQTDKRDELKKYLEANDIETKIQHPILMPNQPAYNGWTRSEKLNAEKVVAKILCLPASEKLTQQEQGYVINKIVNFFE